MRFDVITLFPEWVRQALDIGVVGRAFARGLLTLNTLNPRDFSEDPNRRVDDRPFGGGAGMVMCYEPLARTIAYARKQASASPVLMMAPHGKRLTQSVVAELSKCAGMILLCGRYEGIDQRLLDDHVDDCYSLGDFVLSGGEIPAVALIDAVARLQPAVLGHDDSAMHDSFSDGLLEHPHYTRPQLIGEQAVPAVLGSGDHAAIARWRRQQSLFRTWRQRPDLLAAARLSDTDQRLLRDEIDRYNGRLTCLKDSD